jgi:hypothetical protein
VSDGAAPGRVPSPTATTLSTEDVDRAAQLVAAHRDGELHTLAAADLDVTEDFRFRPSWRRRGWSLPRCGMRIAAGSKRESSAILAPRSNPSAVAT